MTRTQDEKNLRALIADWMNATNRGDLAAVLELMDPRVIFLRPGQPPMRGRRAFARGFQQVLQTHRLKAKSDIQEIKVVGDLAYCWNRLTVTVTPLGQGPTGKREGDVLSIFQKQSHGHWLLIRDANLLAGKK